jgi:hypothetical protein
MDRRWRELDWWINRARVEQISRQAKKTKSEETK